MITCEKTERKLLPADKIFCSPNYFVTQIQVHVNLIVIITINDKNKNTYLQKNTPKIQVQLPVAPPSPSLQL